MGISVQQYRAAIGNWQARRSRQRVGQVPFMHADTQNACLGEHVHSVLFQGPRKIACILLYVLAVTFFTLPISWMVAVLQHTILPLG